MTEQKDYCKDCEHARYDILNPAKMGVCVKDDQNTVIRIYRKACPDFKESAVKVMP